MLEERHFLGTKKVDTCFIRKDLSKNEETDFV